MELKGKKVNFLGDSITEGVGVSAPEYCYVNVVKELLGLAEARNYGISATRIARQRVKANDGTRRDDDFCMRVSEMDEDADVVVVFGGTNDYGHGDAPFGEFSDRTPDTFYGACHTLMRSLLERFPDSRIVFMTPLHRRAEITEGKHPFVDYVAAIKEVGAHYGLPVLDLCATSGLTPEVEIIKKKYMPDGLHPNNAGARRVAECLAAFLKSL